MTKMKRSFKKKKCKKNLRNVEGKKREHDLAVKLAWRQTQTAVTKKRNVPE